MTEKRLNSDSDWRAGPVHDPGTISGSFSVELIRASELLERLERSPAQVIGKGMQASSAANNSRAHLLEREGPNAAVLRNLLLGNTLPPLSVLERTSGWTLVSGMHGVQVLQLAIEALTEAQSRTPADGSFDEELRRLADIGLKPIAVQELLDQPVVVQIWRDLSPVELVQLSLSRNILSVADPRTLFTWLEADLRSMFESWGIKLLTSEQERLVPRRRGRRPPELLPIPSIYHYRFDSLADALLAYLSGDPQIKTRTSGQERLQQLRTDALAMITAERDFGWACLEFNRVVNKKYADDPKWRGILQISENFLVPMMAAFGRARCTPTSHPDLERHQSKLLERLEQARVEDPLRFNDGTPSCLEAVLNDVRSNIGRGRRSIVFNAWISLSRRGMQGSAMPIDWRSGPSNQKSEEEPT